jgi:hypothetical protein
MPCFDHAEPRSWRHRPRVRIAGHWPGNGALLKHPGPRSDRAAHVPAGLQPWLNKRTFRVRKTDPAVPRPERSSPGHQRRLDLGPRRLAQATRSAHRPAAAERFQSRLRRSLWPADYQRCRLEKRPAPRRADRRSRRHYRLALGCSRPAAPAEFRRNPGCAAQPGSATILAQRIGEA